MSVSFWEASAPVGTFSDPWYDLKAFGAKGNDATDDAPAVANWLTQLRANTAMGFVPPGGYVLNSSIVQDCALQPFTIMGAGKAGMSRFLAGLALNGVMFNLANMKDTVWLNIGANGIARSTRMIQSVMGTTGPPPLAPSGETSTGFRAYNLTATNFTDYHIYLDGHEDAFLFGCHINPTGSIDKNGLFWNIPGGAADIFGCTIVGILNLCYQKFTIHGGVTGPIRINNSTSSIVFSLLLLGVYVYDTATFECVSAIDHWTDLLADGCYFVMANRADCMKGPMLAGVTIKLAGCGFVMVAPNANVSVFIFNSTAAGAGGIIIEGGSAALLAGVTMAPLRNTTGGTAVCLLATGINRTGGTAMLGAERSVASPAFPTSNGGVPATNAVQNTFQFALEIVMQLGGLTIGANGIQVGPDDVNWTDIGVPHVALPAQYTVTKKVRPLEWITFHYTAGVGTWKFYIDT